MLALQIEKDIVEAMKTKDEATLSTLRLLKSALTNYKISTQKELVDADVLGVIQKEIKSRRDSVKLYEEGNRPELAEKEQKEIAILEKYLPEQASEEEIRTKAKVIIAKTGAAGIADMGKVMGVLMGEFKGKADGSLVSRVVKEELTK